LSHDSIPIIGTYRGVGIHDQQPQTRVNCVVKPEIDHVLDDLSDISDLYNFAANAANSPEARLLAAAKIMAEFDLAVEERRARPLGITMEKVRAAVAGVDSQEWRSNFHYGSALDHGPPPGVKWPARDVPLDVAGCSRRR
jgi:hypothetical protein